jgi:hypothetical protein
MAVKMSNRALPNRGSASLVQSLMAFDMLRLSRLCALEDSQGSRQNLKDGGAA